MKKCIIDGCPFPGIAYFGDFEEPVNEDEIRKFKDTCFFCEGKGCRICDETGEMTCLDYTGETRKIEYRECLFHYGVFCYIAYFFDRFIKAMKGWIS